jgi:hypothetical protein
MPYRALSILIPIIVLKNNFVSKGKGCAVIKMKVLMVVPEISLHVGVQHGNYSVKPMDYLQ